NESELTPHQFTRRKRGLINAEVIALSTNSFAIVHLEGETNICITTGHVKREGVLMVNVTTYILDGYEKMKIEVNSEINMVKEIKKKIYSNSEYTSTKQKENNGELHVGNEVALMCEMIELKEICEFVRSMDNLKNLLNHKAFDKQSSSNLSNDDVLIRSLVQKDETERIINLDSHEVVVVLNQEVDKIKEGENKVFAHLNNSNELDSKFSQSIVKECSRPSKFDKLSSSNVSIDVLHLMSPLFQEVENTSFENLELQNIVPIDKVHREINDHVVVTLTKNEGLTISFSYNEENIEQVPISQSLEIENNENAHVEKGLPYEDNY
ncbi:hypothetical protein H5410_021495, partial [Solanum commersonii]